MLLRHPSVSTWVTPSRPLRFFVAPPPTSGRRDWERARRRSWRPTRSPTVGLALASLSSHGSVKAVLRSMIVGTPGSGKSTLALRIIKHFQLKKFSSGDVL
ncbi:hypothetical protein EI555_021199 [Monodon monoceros]|uniref:Uncharacterized protein n=1 Tax=Monodon monoceros TaxID=40151 RepID=A0A4U1ED56_MONMO|nr:hypothetical protein EI555_021199 [Monodon monoceros]